MGLLGASPEAAPPVPLLLPPLLDAGLGRENPQLRHAKLGMEVQGCLCLRWAGKVFFMLLHVAVFQLVHHQQGL